MDSDMEPQEYSPLLRSPSDSAERDTNTRCRQSTPRILTVEPALLLFALYRAAIMPVQQQYLYMRIGQNMNISQGKNSELHCYSNKSDPQYILQQNVQSETSLWMIYLNVCTLVPAFFSTIFIGGYSDKGGRKIGLICPVIGGILKLYVLLVIMIYDFPIELILVAGFLEGMFGSIAMFLMGAFSYISDVTTPQQRSLRIIILEVCLGLAATASFLASGYLIEELGYQGTTMIIHVIIVFTLFVIYILPETINSSETVKFWTMKHFVRTFRVYLVDNGNGRRVMLLSSIAILAFFCPARLGSDNVQTLSMLNDPLCWNSVYVGAFKALYYFVTSIAGIMLTKLAAPRWGDLPLVIIGSVFGTIHMAYWSVADTNVMMFLVPFVGIFSGLPIGMLRAFSSKIVSPHELGAMFSWVAWLELVGSLVGNVSFNAIYSATLTWFKGFVFCVIALLYLCGTLVTVGLFVWMKKRGLIVRHQITS